MKLTHQKKIKLIQEIFNEILKICPEAELGEIDEQTPTQTWVRIYVPKEIIEDETEPYDHQYDALRNRISNLAMKILMDYNHLIGFHTVSRNPKSQTMNQYA